VRRLYEEGKTEREIARLLEVSRWHVGEPMQGAGIERRLSGLPRPVSRDALRRLAVDQGLSQSQLARMFGVANATVRIWLAECGLGQSDARIAHDQLRQLYVESRLTTREVAAHFGVSHHRVIRELALAELGAQRSGPRPCVARPSVQPRPVIHARLDQAVIGGADAGCASATRSVCRPGRTTTPSRSAWRSVWSMTRANNQGR